jgi:hypothetical protein
MTDLDKLEALAKAATPGEWRAWITRRRQPEIYTDGGSSEQNDKIASGVLRRADAAFIEAAQPATILDLIASARRDAEEIERLRAFAGRMIELVGTAFYDGFRDAIDREKWDDCYDYAAVKGSDYARDAVQKLTARAAHTGEG